jgi:hypothetical protein
MDGLKQKYSRSFTWKQVSNTPPSSHLELCFVLFSYSVFVVYFCLLIRGLIKVLTLLLLQMCLKQTPTQTSTSMVFAHTLLCLCVMYVSTADVYALFLFCVCMGRASGGWGLVELLQLDVGGGEWDPVCVLVRTLRLKPINVFYLENILSCRFLFTALSWNVYLLMDQSFHGFYIWGVGFDLNQMFFSSL